MRPGLAVVSGAPNPREEAQQQGRSIGRTLITKQVLILLLFSLLLPNQGQRGRRSPFWDIDKVQVRPEKQHPVDHDKAKLLIRNNNKTQERAPLEVLKPPQQWR